MSQLRSVVSIPETSKAATEDAEQPSDRKTDGPKRRRDKDTKPAANDPISVLKRELSELAQQKRVTEGKLKNLHWQERTLLRGDKKRENGISNEEKSTTDKPPAVGVRRQRSTDSSTSDKPSELESDRPLKRRVLVRRDAEDKEEETPQVRSSVVVSNGETEPGEIGAAEERRSAPKVDLAQRNRRMFGTLLGHLNSARSQLSQDARLKKKQEIDERIEKKKQEQRVEILEETKQKIADERTRELARRKELVVQKAQKEALLSELILKRQEDLLSNFIMTQTKPSVFYLPKQHTPKTEGLLEQCRRERQAKKELIRVEPAIEDTDFDATAEEKTETADAGEAPAPAEAGAGGAAATGEEDGDEHLEQENAPAREGQPQDGPTDIVEDDS